MNIEWYINENERRNIKSVYDQVTGEGCYGERFRLDIEDAPFTTMFLPIEMQNEKPVKELLKHKSISRIYESMGYEITKEEYDYFWIQFCELRIKFDYEYYAVTYQTIKDKTTAEDIPFRLNRGQRRVLARLEKMRKAGRPIYLILLKARQWGGSTLIQMYMNWIQIVHKKNWNSVICAHIKDSAITVRSMYDNVITNMPIYKGRIYKIRNYAQTQNIKYVPESGAKITIGTAQEPESVRGQDVKMAHFSEIGLYPNTEKMKTENLIASIVSSIPKNIPLTFIAYESTAQGVGDYFHTQWLKAEANETMFDPVFISWFLIDIYREEFDGTYNGHTGREKIKGSIADFIKTLDEYEINLFNTEDECTLENINWYRSAKKTSASISTLKQEFPSNADEAFQGSGRPVFRSEDVERQRKNCIPPISIGDIISECSPSMARIKPELQKNILKSIQYIEDSDITKELSTADPRTRHIKELNKFKIWEYPDYELNVSDRYIVTLDPSKGKSSGADNAVILVLDRYWKIYGGKTEVVAELVIKEDKDIVVWISAMIATYYRNALLVIESNTIESTDRYSDSEFIFDTLSNHYSNLYSRISADQLKENVPIKYGFHTNKSTKPMIIDNYIAYLREDAYVERSDEALNEARTYETNKSGQMGAKQGCKDDRLMTRAIGLYIDSELPIPKLIDKSKKQIRKSTANESSF